jgi:hypothetical protein
MIDGFPLSFFLPLVVHALAGLTMGVTGVVAFRAPKRRGRHHRWGHTICGLHRGVFHGDHPVCPAVGRRRQPLLHGADRVWLRACWLRGTTLSSGTWLMRLLGKQWVVAHIVGVIGSYIVLWTAFYVDNAHLIPGLNQLPPLTFWVLPTMIGIPFIVRSISPFVPNWGAHLPDRGRKGTR